MKPRRIILVLLVAAVAAMGVALLSGGVSSSSRGLATGAGLLAAIALTVGLVAWAITLVTRRGRESVHDSRTPTQIALDNDLQLVATPPEDFVAPYVGLPGVPRNATISNVYSGTLTVDPAGTGATVRRGLVAFQSVYMIHTGHAPVPVSHTLYVLENPSRWPTVLVSPRRGLGRLLAGFGVRPGLELDDPAFNAAFRVVTDDEDFALLLLSPDMQRFLIEKPVRWQVLPGRIVLVYRGALRADRLETSLDRLRRFTTHIPEELEAWDDPDDDEPDDEPNETEVPA